MRITKDAVSRILLICILLFVGLRSSVLNDRAQNKRAKKLPSFSRVLLLEQTAETSANVSIGDLNGDGFADLVLAKGRHWPLVDRVLLNDGQGRFPTATWTVMDCEI